MRVKRGVAAHKKHAKIRKAARGMTQGNRSSIRRSKQATTRALQFAYRDRRNRKRTFRQLWNARINAGARLHERRSPTPVVSVASHHTRVAQAVPAKRRRS